MTGILFIVSSPSGGGKTTLIKRAMAELGAAGGGETYFSVSHTTRPPRPGELDGRDYHFVDRAAFDAMRSAGAFLEWAEYAGHLYGTSRSEVEGRLESGIDVFLDIEVQGAQKVKTSVPGAVKIFIVPPSYDELKRRLHERRKDDAETIRRRLEWARGELETSGEFDYGIVNDRLDEAVRALVAICTAEHHRMTRFKPRLDEVRRAFASALSEDDPR